ncbi:MAG: glutamine synthetase, partial [Lentisphaerae bacterium]|nr:glutamine synthetase [Lentisphaerota bacterium]
MEVQFYYPESGPGQHEISIKNTDPLTAADNQILY